MALSHVLAEMLSSPRLLPGAGSSGTHRLVTARAASSCRAYLLASNPSAVLCDPGLARSRDVDIGETALGRADARACGDARRSSWCALAFEGIVELDFVE